MDLLHTLGPGVFDVTFFLSFLLMVYSFLNHQTLMTVIIFCVLYYTYTVVKRRAAKYVQPTGKYVLITGCDSGIGNALAFTLDKNGFNVLATCLKGDSKGAAMLKKLGSKRLAVLELDVSSDDSVAMCCKYVEKECAGPGLWGLVNNAGINFIGDVELSTMKQYIEINNVNNFGIVRTTKAFLPLIRRAKGRVVNVTSIKGRLAMPTVAAYSMTKWAGENFSDTLRLEVTRFGVKVIVMEPGHFGGATGCLNEEGMSRIRKDLDEQWEEASDGVKQTYGKDYLETQFTQACSYAKTSAPTVEPIMAAFKEALLNESPQMRYVIPGTNGLCDIGCICVPLYGRLPEWVMDKISNYCFGGGPTPKALEKEISNTR